MQILRIVNIQVINSTSISVTFTESLTKDLITSNVSIVSDTINVPDSSALQISISGSTLSITCQPLTPLATYFLQFQSVNLHPFISLNGEAKISEDGVSNRFLITAPLEPDNPIQNYLNDYLRGNIYNNEDSNTIIANYIQSLSIVLARALYDIRQVKNENYLSFDVVDEQITRGGGPFDRLSEEGAYEVVRVGLTTSDATASNTFSFDFFPFYPVTLQRQDNIETLTVNSLDEPGFFDINSLTLNLNNSPVTRVTSIVFTLNTINPVYVYNIPLLGYQLLDSNYDQDFASTYLQLENNQVRLNESILTDPLFSLNNILRIDIQYESKNLGIVVDPTTVNAYTIQNVTREVIPPIINIFTLKHAPITDSSNNIPILGGAIFIDPNSNTGSPHPAFRFEIPFRFEAMPSTPGQYSIDYASGTVYVFGADSKNDGTGPFPPLVNYQYRLVYQSEIDYVYDPDALDFVALPNGSLVNFQGNVNFQYEQVLIPGTDYTAALHQEALTERIDNRLVALNAFRTVNSPITNVFKILNETSGELYTLDRWNDNKVYFRYNTPPRLLAQTGERASFEQIVNELLFINTILTNSSFLKVFKIFLNNNMIVDQSEDGLGASFNSSATFTDGNVFVQEKWFNQQFDESSNINRLFNVGEYMVDYVNGVVYCAVSSTQGSSIGTVTYKINSIVPQFPHVISADDIYYRITLLEPINKSFAYTSFGDGFITPETLDPADEAFLNNTLTAPYQLVNGSVGSFIGINFVPGVTNQVKFVRSVFEYDDLLNSTHPFNFAQASTSNGFNISVGTVSKQVFESVQFDGINYFILLNENIPFLSPNITYNFSVVRASDLAQLWSGNLGNVVPGNPVKLILTNHNPALGDQVNVTYTLTINSISRVVVDYNKGDFFIDYTYLADEIIVSYEYGDNVLDFRQSQSVPAGTQYYVSYRVGALRDALLKNFGTLVNVPELSTFDVDFARERYRDALMAAMTSFIQGPTVTAIKNIAKTISHIEPEVIESAFLNWSLGSSLLVPESIQTTGSFELLPAKFGNGVLVNQPNQTVTFPVNSNLRFEEGTLETWVVPQWNGLDNDAQLTFTILKNGNPIPANNVFLGAAENHPQITNGVFTLNKLSNVGGTPNVNKDGVFIYYDNDISGNFQRWYVRVLDGYVNPTSSNYKFTINSTGGFYDNKSMVLPKPFNLTIFTGTRSINFSLTGGTGITIDEGVTFISDVDHYLFDFGDDETNNRFSIYKDISGYLNFRVYDKCRGSYSISADVSGWQVGQIHNVAVSWKLGTRNQRDEMHLFVDGFEVPNIIKYGQKLSPYLHEKFRTVNPEEVVGLIHRDVVGSVDLQTIFGSDLVTSSINFSSFNIFPGDTIFIDQAGFNPAGYTILFVNGQSLTLSSPMPATITNGTFSVNRTQFTITSDIDVAPNVAVTTIHSFVSGMDLSGLVGGNTVTSALVNFSTANVLPGYLLKVDNSNLSAVYTILQVSGNTLTINGNLPASFSNNSFQVYTTTENEIPGLRAIRPSYSISKDNNFNNILTISNNVFAGDLILVRTLGLNHKKVKKQYYVWSDEQENILRTQLPPPISLNEANITKIIIPTTFIGPSNSVLSGGQFYSFNFSATPPSNSQNGRTISAVISGNNVDFSSPVSITINGQTGIYTVNETITLTDYGSLDFVNMYNAINYVNVVAKPLNSNKNALTFEIREKYPITHAEASGHVSVVRFSYYMGGGYGLYQVGSNAVRDDSFLFSGLDIGNYLLISSPNIMAGFYVITGLSADRHTVYINPTNAAATIPLPSFSSGIYQVLNTTSYRSGLQNGFFTFEDALLPSQAYFLHDGLYELEYFTYIGVNIDSSNDKAYVGSDFRGHRQFNGIINQLKIYSTMLTDTRIGETIPANQRSITKDFNSLTPLKADPNTLVLAEFDTFPFANIAGFYTNTNKISEHFQSSVVINENFGNSLVFLDKPLLVENDGILDTRKQGTIEFWVSPLIDTGNDPSDRFYFDAFGAVVEEAVSTTSTSVKISAPASQILNVKLQSGDPHIDYFVGGKLEIDTQHAIQEDGTSIGTSSVITSQPILQVITVKIAGDPTGTDYFANGSIGSDQKTIFLGLPLPASNLPLIITYQTTSNKNVTLNTQIIRLNRQLPYQNTKVLVTYIPQGLQGDRMSIFKDRLGFMNFVIVASGTDYVLRAPTRWVRNTWHRVKASYKMNGGIGQDEMRLFLDGYEYSDVTFGSGIVFGQFPYVFGASMPGDVPDGYDGYGLLQSIQFKDPINDFYIGSQFTEESPIFSLMDNFRISNISRPIYAPFGESLDVNYSSNLNTVNPVTSDLYTTFLMDWDEMIALNTDFTVLKNRETGSFDFTVNVLDSFGIVKDNIKSQEALEELIKVLKPANSRVFINYIR